MKAMDTLLAVIGAFDLVVSGFNRVLDQIIQTMERLQKIRPPIHQVQRAGEKEKGLPTPPKVEVLFITGWSDCHRSIPSCF